LVDKIAIITFGFSEPVDDSWDDLANILLVEFETGVVINRTALIEVGGVNEVPVALPSTALCFNLISKGCAFYKRISAFKMSKYWINI